MEALERALCRAPSAELFFLNGDVNLVILVALAMIYSYLPYKGFARQQGQEVDHCCRSLLYYRRFRLVLPNILATFIQILLYASTYSLEGGVSQCRPARQRRISTMQKKTGNRYRGTSSGHVSKP